MAQAYNELEYNTEGYSSTNNSPSTVTPLPKMKYNAQPYNGANYNGDHILLSLTPINLEGQYNKTKYNLDYYNELENLFDTPLVLGSGYNTFEYNEHQYHQDSNVVVFTLTDSIGLSENPIGKSANKVTAETLPISEILTKNVNKSTSEFLGLVDQLARSVDNKGLAETLDIDLWLDIDKNDDNSPFTGV